MWSYLSLLLIAGAVVAANCEHDHGWITNNEYKYSIRSRTMSSMDKLKNQFSGVLLKGILTVQVKSPESLLATLTEPQLAHVHTDMEKWDSKIPDDQLEYKQMPISSKPFEIRLKHGIIRELVIDSGVPIWEVNILKSIASQLQVDTQGENALMTNGIQIPTDDEPRAMFTVVEDSVGGKCEVLYDIMPLSHESLEKHPELVPLPEINHNGVFIDIMKTKNYTKCVQQSEFHFGIDGRHDLGPAINQNAGFLEKSSMSRVVIGGSLKKFTIQSSVTTSRIYISPQMNGDFIGTIHSRMNLTLASLKDRDQSSAEELTPPNDPVSTGNLVYMYNTHKSLSRDHIRRPSISKNSMPVSSSESSDSSASEETGRTLMSLLSNNRLGRNVRNEQIGNLQPKPKLDEAPKFPFPVDRDFDKLNPLIEAARLSEEITREIEKNKDLSAQSTLEKFTILIDMICRMSFQEIQQLQERSSVNKDIFFEVVRDAVAYAGTGPALLTIKKWIKDGQLETFQAARVVSIIPKSARIPTSEYIAEVFELMKEPVVQQQLYVNGTVPSAFAELIFNVIVSKTKSQYLYPVNTYGPMVSKDDRALFDIYIPYMGKQMKEAMKANDSPRTQAYIMGLGKIGHPQVLSIFEPYLEGKLPTTKYQRVLMVASLMRLTENYPELARSVLYKIYTNTDEAHEVRCMAVYNLMKTNPPLVMLQRMAQYTNFDKSSQVNSIVKSSIEKLAETDVPHQQELSSKARIAKKLLSPKVYGVKFPNEFHVKSYVLKTLLKNIETLNLKTIGSDNEWPMVYYTKDLPGTPKSEIAFAVSNIRQFFSSSVQSRNDGDDDNDDDDDDSSNNKGKSIFAQIMRALKMRPQEQERLEGSFFFNDIYGSQTLPFDDYLLDKLIEDYWLTDKNRNYNFLCNHNVLVTDVTESGLVFFYRLDKPLLVRTVAKNPEPSPSSAQGNGMFHLTFVSKRMSRSGIISILDGTTHMSGVDNDLLLRAPIDYTYERNVNDKVVSIQMRPHTRQSQLKLAHYSVRPFTTIIDSENAAQPVWDNGNTRIVRVLMNQQKMKFNYDAVSFNVQSDTEQPKDFGSLIAQVFSMWREDNVRFTVIDLYTNNVMDKDWLGLTMSYGEKAINNIGQQHARLQSVTDIPSTFGAISDVRERRNSMLKEVSKGLRNPVAQTVNLIVDLPQMSHRYTAIIGMADSNTKDNNVQQALFYLQSIKAGNNVDYEVCATGETQSSHNVPLDFEKAMEFTPVDRITLKMRYGSTCANGNRLDINSTQTRNVQMSQAIMSSDIAKKCMEEMRQGNKALRACQKANELAQTKNHWSLSMNIPDEAINMFVNVASLPLGIRNTFVQENTKMLTRRDGGKQHVNMDVTVSPDFKNAEVTLNNPYVDLKLPPIDISHVEQLRKKANWLWQQDDRDVSCTIDKTHVITFDDKMYPVKMGKCQHVMMTAVLQKDTDDQSTRQPKLSNVAVLTKDDADNGREVSFILGSTTIGLRKTDDDFDVTINGKTIAVPSDGFQHIKNGQLIAEILRLTDKSMLVLSKKFGINAVFDGERIQLQLSDDYRNAIRGLCGNYDTRAENDFITPKNCVLEKPEDFTAMYALTDRDCQGSALLNKRRAELAKCVQQSYRQSNVISDREAGRPWTENKQWGYHWDQQDQAKQCTRYRTKIVEEDDSICFTLRPIPTCTANCKPTEIKMKRIPLHCLPKSDASKQMKQRIEQGANPDMSQRSVTKTKIFQVPFACTAA